MADDKNMQEERAFSFAAQRLWNALINRKCKKCSNTDRVQEKAENPFVSEVLQQLIMLYKHQLAVYCNWPYINHYYYLLTS